MKKYVFSIVLVSIIISGVALGCASVRRSVSDYETCYNDPKCKAQMDYARDLTENAIITTTSATPIFAQPVGTLIASGASSLVSLIFGVYLGGKKRRGVS